MAAMQGFWGPLSVDFVIIFFSFIFILLLLLLLTYSMEHSPSWEANRSTASQAFPAFYGIRNFITAFISACHLYLSWASSTQSMLPHTTSRRYILTLSSHLRLVLPSGLFPSGFPTRTLYTPLLFLMCATYPAHLILLDLITRTYGVRSINYSATHYVVSPTPLLSLPS